MDYWKLGCDYWGKGRFNFYSVLIQHSIVICGECDMKIGDAVAIADGYTVKAIAIVTSKRQPVTELPLLENPFKQYEIEYKDSVTVANANIIELPKNEQFRYQLRQGIRQIQKPEIIQKIKVLISEFNSNSFSDNKTMTTIYQPYINLLRATHNLILTGAPGTGKTYLARQIAEAMGAEVGFVQFHPSYDYTDFVEGLRPIQDDNGNVGFERKDGVFKAFCKKALKTSTQKEDDIFDKAWDALLNQIREGIANEKLIKIGSWEYSLSKFDSLKYTSSNSPSKYTFTITKQNIYDVYQGKKARPSGGYQKDMQDIVDYMQTKFNLAQYVPNQEQKKDFVFIIDEINRGEISKIFGELFFSIDPGYRGEKGRVQTQYQNIVEDGDIFKKGFFVPENVYIIGTMNDIDRSVESMDFAFRRRFAFKEIKADENVGMLENLTQKVEAINRMKKLNAAIEKVDGLSSAYHIGASYFLKLKDYDGDFGKLWEYHLEGLLREYLRGTQDVDKEIEKLKTAYNDESDHNNGQPQQAN